MSFVVFISIAQMLLCSKRACATVEQERSLRKSISVGAVHRLLQRIFTGIHDGFESSRGKTNALADVGRSRSLR